MGTHSKEPHDEGVAGNLGTWRPVCVRGFVRVALYPWPRSPLLIPPVLTRESAGGERTHGTSCNLCLSVLLAMVRIVDGEIVQDDDPRLQQRPQQRRPPAAAGPAAATSPAATAAAVPAGAPEFNLRAPPLR